jgi:hypothetical protein
MVASVRPRAHALAVTLAVVLAAAVVAPAAADAAALQIASDPFTQATCAASATTNHSTEVEPDTFSNGSTIVSAFQEGRIYDGGACAIGFARSSNNDSSWTTGLLPGITKYAGRGPNDRATDPPVTYDAAHNVWLVSSLTLLDALIDLESDSQTLIRASLIHAIFIKTGPMRTPGSLQIAA